MLSWLIGKTVFRMWKNRWLSLTRSSPLMGLLPAVLAILLAAISVHVFLTARDQLRMLSGGLAKDSASLMLQNFAWVTFGLILLATLFFHHWILYGGMRNRLLETLPVPRRTWILGLLLPGLLLELILIILLLWPILLVLTEPMGPGVQAVALPLHLLLMTSAGSWGLVWQHVLFRIVRHLSAKSGLTSDRAWHSALLTASLFLAVCAGYFFQVWGIRDETLAWLPPELFARALLNAAPDALGGLAVWILAAWGMLRPLVRHRESWQAERASHWMPLSGWPFFRHPSAAFASLELKQWARDLETHLYTGLFILLLALAGQAAGLAGEKARAVFGIVFSTVVFYGLPYFLSVYPLRSHSRTCDAGTKWIPATPAARVTGKMLPHLTAGPLVTTGLAHLIIRISGFEPFGAEGWVRLMLNTALIHAVAFFTGMAVPFRRNSASGMVLLHLVFLVISIPLFFAAGSLWKPEAPAWNVVATCALLFLVWFAAVVLETRREES